MEQLQQFEDYLIQEEKSETAQVNRGYALFCEDAGNIDNSAPESFEELVKISALLAQNSYDLADGGCT